MVAPFEGRRAEDPLLKFDRETLEIAFTTALRTVFPSFKTEDARAEFYALYKRESEEFDRDFIKKYDDDLNTSLIFAGLFSAVSSAFIIDVQSDLKPDYNKATATLIRVLVNKIDNTSFPQVDLSTLDWTGPNPTLVNVQTLLYASLAVSLLSAFLAMLGKQWLNRYDHVEKRGSLIDRSRDRQLKLDGMATWGFKFVMEGLPLMLQVGLLLLGCALSRYLWIIDHTIAEMVVGVTSFGVVFYAFIVLSATLSYNCPFQTPSSLLLRSILTYDNEHRRYLSRTCSLISSGLRMLFSPLYCYRVIYHAAPTELNHKLEEDIELSTSTEATQEMSPIFKEQEVDWDGYTSDARCLTWMMEASTDRDVAMSAMRMVPEVEWHAGVDTIPSLLQLYDTVSACLDLTGTRPSLIPTMRNKAYVATKAFVHLFIQRCCVDKEEVPILALRTKHRSFGSHIGLYDNDLKSLLLMMDHIIQGFKDILWTEPDFSQSHTAWLCHILVYHLWEMNRNGDARRNQLPEGLYHLLEQTLASEPPPAQPVVADCMLILSLTIGLPLDVKDLWMVDKSSASADIAKRLYDGLSRTFRTPTSSRMIDRSLDALRVLACWQKQSKTDIEQHQRLSYALSQSIISSWIDDNLKWDAARLAFHIGFRDTEPGGACGEAAVALAFLEYHFSLENYGESHYDSVADAFVALSHCSHLMHFKLTDGPFLQGLSCALESDKPPRLRRTALLFIRWVRDQFFDSTLDSVMDAAQRSAICCNIAAIANQLEEGETAINRCCLTILLRMAHSLTWRPYLVLDHWKALQRLSSRYADLSGTMQQCLNDADLLKYLRGDEYEEALTLWMKVVWTRFELLSPEVLEQVVETTLDLFHREGMPLVEEFQALIDAEQNDIENVIHRTPSWEASMLKSMRAKLDTAKRRRTTMKGIFNSVGTLAES